MVRHRALVKLIARTPCPISRETPITGNADRERVIPILVDLGWEKPGVRPRIQRQPFKPRELNPFNIRFQSNRIRQFNPIPKTKNSRKIDLALKVALLRYARQLRLIFKLKLAFIISIYCCAISL